MAKLLNGYIAKLFNCYIVIVLRTVEVSIYSIAI
jgi:hypothetical protein